LSILRDLISIYSPTFNEEQIAEYIASTYFNSDLWEVRIDDMHNIMASPKGNTKNDLPLLVAHHQGRISGAFKFQETELLSE